MRRKKGVRRLQSVVGCLTISCSLMLTVGCDREAALDAKLQKVIASKKLRAIEKPPPQNKELVELGRLLFFDRELSGTRDTSCATCHHPKHGTADGRPLPAGVGGEGLGLARKLQSHRKDVARHAPPLFNLGDSGWTTHLWDMRTSLNKDGTLNMPVMGARPGGLLTLLAAQAMFPVTSRDEMRGQRNEKDVKGKDNELGAIFTSQQSRLWDALMARILSHEEYRERFARAFPKTPREELTFQHAANAIAIFEIEAFSPTDTPWDRYLRGEKDAMNARAKRGALRFFGPSGCSTCHSGALFTDQLAHNIAVPQFGPGKRPEEPLDYGRERETMNPMDRFAFRTPPLRQVKHTAPYMHNGAHESLEDAIRQHLNPEVMLRSYEGKGLGPKLAATIVRSRENQDQILKTLSPRLAKLEKLDAAGMEEILAFLEALSSPSLTHLQKEIPEKVPSGLPVDR